MADHNLPKMRSAGPRARVGKFGAVGMIELRMGLPFLETFETYRPSANLLSVLPTVLRTSDN
jgi:hypothetical protein